MIISGGEEFDDGAEAGTAVGAIEDDDFDAFAFEGGAAFGVGGGGGGDEDVVRAGLGHV